MSLVIKKQTVIKIAKRAALIWLLLFMLGKMVGCVYGLYGAFVWGCDGRFSVCDGFKKHKKGCNSFVKYCARFDEDFENDENLSFVYLKESGNGVAISYHYKDDMPSKEQIEEDEQLKAYIDILFHKVFTAHADNRVNFMGCRVSRDRIVFNCDRPYYIVYKKDPFFSMKEEGSDCFINRITWRWYEVYMK